eukprot:2489230-Rhodomonas_salina.2
MSNEEALIIPRNKNRVAMAAMKAEEFALLLKTRNVLEQQAEPAISIGKPVGIKTWLCQNWKDGFHIGCIDSETLIEIFDGTKYEDEVTFTRILYSFNDMQCSQFIRPNKFPWCVFSTQSLFREMGWLNASKLLSSISPEQSKMAFFFLVHTTDMFEKEERTSVNEQNSEKKRKQVEDSFSSDSE